METPGKYPLSKFSPLSTPILPMRYGNISGVIGLPVIIITPILPMRYGNGTMVKYRMWGANSNPTYEVWKLWRQDI